MLLIKRFAVHEPANVGFSYKHVALTCVILFSRRAAIVENADRVSGLVCRGPRLTLLPHVEKKKLRLWHT